MIGAKLFVEGEERNLLNASFLYHRLIDKKGQPASPTLGGELVMNMESSNQDEIFFKWLIEEDEEGNVSMKNGKVVFMDFASQMRLFEYRFKDGCCVHYKEVFDSTGKQPMTLSVRISAPVQEVRDLQFIKPWMVQLPTSVYAENRKPAEIKEEELIAVKVSYTSGEFVPLSVPDSEGKPTEGKLGFKISILHHDAEKRTIEILKDGKVIYQESDEAPGKLKKGDHKWFWDGFDTSEVYDSIWFTNAKMEVRVTVSRKGKKVLDTASIRAAYKGVNWTDLKINRQSKKIDVTIRVNLTDGGGYGMNDWGKVPQTLVNYIGVPPHRTQTRSFKDLEKLVLDGLKLHWGRNSASKLKVGKHIAILGDHYEVFIHPLNTPSNAMEAVKVKYYTNHKPVYSANPGPIDGLISLVANIVANEQISCLYGYIGSGKKWGYFQDIPYADNYVRYLGGHELGHALLTAYKGSTASYRHNKSSTIFQKPLPKSKNGVSYWKNGEIDVMQYHYDEPRINNMDFSRTVASESDVRGLVWISRLDIS